MKFGRVDDPSVIDFQLPDINEKELRFLEKYKSDEPFQLYVGYPKWSKADLKSFYPRGTKDAMHAYSEHFNALEFNGPFYRMPNKDQVIQWKDRTVEDFKFCPKITNSISHYSRLINTDEKVMAFVDATVFFEEKLGMAFLQMPENFKPKNIDRLADFLTRFPKGYPLAVEVRHEEWFADQQILQELHQILRDTHKTGIIVDTPGRRDLLKMQLTSPTAFIRFVSSNPTIDQIRLKDWTQRLREWKEAGLQEAYFFIHQKVDAETSFLSSAFVEELNEILGTELPIATKAP
ncbi:DUF72 domain-containing protein [Sphingobacterium lactis]|uniref:DUF72 domain-containing protein n=1 Tax=Sphingobacterium lactis TaxID=797291 RepID=UPI003F7E5502